MNFALTIIGLVILIALIGLAAIATHAGRVWDENQEKINKPES